MATSQQRQAPERACITFSQISYDQLIKTVVHFSSSFMHCKLDMRLLQGNDNICDFQIFSAATTTAAETLLHFSTQHFSMYPPHNISSVFLTTTTYVRRSGRITNGMLSGRKATQDSAFSSPTPAPTHPEWPSREDPESGLTATAPVSDVSAPACINEIWPPLRPVSVAQKNKPSTMLSSNVQSIDLPTNCMAWRC